MLTTHIWNHRFIGEPQNGGVENNKNGGWDYTPWIWGIAQPDMQQIKAVIEAKLVVDLNVPYCMLFSSILPWRISSSSLLLLLL